MGAATGAESGGGVMTPRAKTADYATESTDQALSELTTEVYEDDEPG